MSLPAKLGVSLEPNGKTGRPLSGILDRFVSIVAIAMSLYHVYTAVFGTPEWLRHRPLHVCFAMVIGFLTYKSSKKADNTFSVIRDIIFSLLAASIYLYIVLNFKRFSLYMFPITKLNNLDYVFIVLTFLFIIELTRRTTGWALIIVSLLFMGQTLFAKYLPGFLNGPGVHWKSYLSYMFLTSDGLFGSTVNVSASYVFLFVMFGVFMEATGVGQFFIEFASTLTSGLRGGAAKCSVLASGLFGSISGSAVANVYATGTFTIPLMKKAGFKPKFAGATEAVASSGGAIMPPVMGSTAFLIADFIGVSYLTIAKSAIIPAILYYLSLWLFVDMEAQKMDMRKAEKVKVDWKHTLKNSYMMLPIVVIIVIILMGRSVFRAAFIAILTTLIVGLIHDPKSVSPKNILKMLDQSGRMSVSIAAPLACASIVVGSIQLTGLGLKLTSLIVHMANGQLWIAMMLTMIITIILGMGLPTPAAYLLVAIFAPSALAQFGVPVLTSHMFCFYYAAFSTITPPVAMAAYAGGNLAGANVNKTGFTAMKLGIAAYIIPWIFTFSNALFLEGSIFTIIQAIVTALVGIYALAGGVQGLFMNKKIGWLCRILLLSSAVCMIISGTSTDLIGLGLFVLVLVFAQPWKKAAVEAKS